MNITLPAYYFNVNDEATIFAVQLCFDADEVRHIGLKVKELAQSIPDFREVVVRFHGRADFIVSVYGDDVELSVPNPDVEALFLNEAGTNVVLKVHAEPISNELFDSANVQNVNLHVTQEGFYVKGSPKYGYGSVETDLIKFTEL